MTPRTAGALLVCLLATCPAGPATSGDVRPAPGPTLPGAPAPAPVLRELRATLADAVRRFEARDVEGVLLHVSDAYRTGPLTKAALRAQLLGLVAVYEALQARVRIEGVHLRGDRAWILSSGEVRGRLPLLGQWMTVLAWERELEVARREAGVWRLYGLQD